MPNENRKPVRNMRDEASREFWQLLEERAEAFDHWAPTWLKNETLGYTKSDATNDSIPTSKPVINELIDVGALKKYIAQYEEGSLTGSELHSLILQLLSAEPTGNTLTLGSCCVIPKEQV